MEEWIKELVRKLLNQSKAYQEMLDTLTEEGLEESMARKILDALLSLGKKEEDDESD